MSKALKTVAVVAGAVALVASGVGAFAAPALAATAAKVATIASVVSAVASVGATIVQPKPPARASITPQIRSARDDPSQWPLDRGCCSPVG